MQNGSQQKALQHAPTSITGETGDFWRSQPTPGHRVFFMILLGHSRLEKPSVQTPRHTGAPYLACFLTGGEAAMNWIFMLHVYHLTHLVVLPPSHAARPHTMPLAEPRASRSTRPCSSQRSSASPSISQARSNLLGLNGDLGRTADEWWAQLVGPGRW